MPKIFLTKEDALSDRLVMLIYGTMKVKRLTQTYMADKLGITQQAFGKKLKKAQFSYLELITVFKVLELPDEKILSVMRER